MAKTHLRRMETLDDGDGDDSRDSIHFEVYIDETDSRPLDKSCPSEWIESYTDFPHPMRHKAPAMMNTSALSSSKQQRQRPDRVCNRPQSATCLPLLDSMKLRHLTHFELFALNDMLRGNRAVEFYIFDCSSALLV